MAVKFCVKCGSPLKEGAKFCTKCGWKLPIVEKSNPKDIDSEIQAETNYNQVEPESSAERLKNMEQTSKTTPPAQSVEKMHEKEVKTEVRPIRREHRVEPERMPTHYDIQPSSSHVGSGAYSHEKENKTGPSVGNLITMGISSVVIVIMVILLLMELR